VVESSQGWRGNRRSFKEYKDFLTNIYLKSLYGMLRAVLLFWKLLLKHYRSVEPYNKCKVNKIIYRNQCTIIWHIVDYKVLHVEKIVVEEIIDNFNKKFGKESALATMLG